MFSEQLVMFGFILIAFIVLLIFIRYWPFKIHRQKNSVLKYQKLNLLTGDIILLEIKEFEYEVAQLSKNGYEFCSFKELYDFTERKTIFPEKAFVILDDYAIPHLEKLISMELVTTSKNVIIFKPIIQNEGNNIVANSHKRVLFLLLCIISFNKLLFSQNRPSNQEFNNTRLRGVVIAESAVGTLTMVGLHYLWYKKFPHSRFHLFNDNNEWLNMDKVGHATTAYNICAFQYNTMQWCGLNNNRSNWIGGLTALGFQTIIEIFDGFSQKWGFSTGDMLANIAGTTLFMAQQFVWKEQRVQLKFSFHKTIYPQYNPGELGKNIWQRWLKDYNGQNYWLSVNPSSFMSNQTDFPRWLNLTFGYGADGMTGAVTNPAKIDNREIPEFKRVRKYFISADANINRLFNKASSPSLFLPALNIMKLPSPAFEFKRNTKMKFYSYYF